MGQLSHTSNRHSGPSLNIFYSLRQDPGCNLYIAESGDMESFVKTLPSGLSNSSVSINHVTRPLSLSSDARIIKPNPRLITGHNHSASTIISPEHWIDSHHDRSTSTHAEPQNISMSLFAGYHVPF